MKHQHQRAQEHEVQGAVAHGNGGFHGLKGRALAGLGKRQRLGLFGRAVAGQ